MAVTLLQNCDFSLKLGLALVTLLGDLDAILVVSLLIDTGPNLDICRPRVSCLESTLALVLVLELREGSNLELTRDCTRTFITTFLLHALVC